MKTGDSIMSAAFRLCSVLLPPARSEWLQAMRVEASCIYRPDEARTFALGCVWACLKERVSTMDFVHKITGSAMMLGMLVLGVFGAFGAWRASGVHGPTGLVFVVLSIVFFTSCIWSYFRGPEALAQAASTMLFINAAAFVALRASPGDGWVNLDLYRALSAEGILVWGALLAGAIFLRRHKRAKA